MTQKEIRLEERPWVTQGLLVSMCVCDNLREQIACKEDPVVKADFSRLYKCYCNMIVNLQRAGKKNYYTSFFQENHGNVIINLITFFTKIGSQIKAKIPKSKKTFILSYTILTVEACS